MKVERTYLRTLLMLSMQRSCYADTEKRAHDCQDCAILSILIMFGSISERLLLYAISLIPLTILMTCSNTIVSTRFAFTTIQQHNVLFSFNSPVYPSCVVPLSGWLVLTSAYRHLPVPTFSSHLTLLSCVRLMELRPCYLRFGRPRNISDVNRRLNLSTYSVTNWVSEHRGALWPLSIDSPVASVTAHDTAVDWLPTGIRHLN